jgi:hypothetical protein
MQDRRRDNTMYYPGEVEKGSKGLRITASTLA